ncbi:phosphotransacetylase [Tamaricihabitans halophyticus]|uniref:Phosphotransacetylase n=1 Tax=Tamaricihabitans halophyticus TaxID=1262583 RepID=A0A4R2QN30_9PSEU|nr:phosphate acyltransferase [Tamaricihabitans halophyticus]TCP50993.1 phosphotransacetylase [Tamaricihabitans halophyticus]
MCAVALGRVRYRAVLNEALRQNPPSSARFEALAHDAVWIAALLLRTGDVDAAVAGAARPTADVLRAGIRVIGLDPDIGTVSSCFLMVLPDGSQFAYADCAVVPEPDANQLADIAIATSRSFHSLTELEPSVAMLSFSTAGSASHANVAKVRLATEAARERVRDLAVDGELQLDAAVVPAVGRRKAPRSSVAGQANVLIFPNLDAGNIAYKTTERFGGAAAIGPIVQGLAAPLNDLSRGCSVADIVGLATVSAVQARQRRRPELLPTAEAR